jgi:ATP-dependent Clp protease ATP-binding subunit ClpC
MASIFERYSQPARRAIFFARFLAVMSDARDISSVDLLGGLLFDNDSRALSLFQLRDHFPQYHGCPYKFAKIPKVNGPPLDQHARQILMWTEDEATRMGDYWIDNEHILLGIMRVPISPAAAYVARTGLTTDVVRKTILDNKSSRPDYGPVPRSWPLKVWFRRTF